MGCHATLGAYNAHPTRHGFWACEDCADEDDGFQTVDEFEKFETFHAENEAALEAEENPDIDDGDRCGICDGPLIELGVLGSLKHLRCRNCGMMTMFPLKWYPDKKKATAEG